MDRPLQIKTIPAADTRPLRRKVLRPHQRLEELHYPGDDAPDTHHIGAFRSGELVGIASIYLEPPGPAGLDAPKGDVCWRLRGMAVSPEFQGSGVGGRLVEACVEHIRKNEGRYFWCNARVPAQRFYEAHGFTAHGDVFELPGIGPHVFMDMKL